MGRKSFPREIDALDLLAHDHHSIERLFHDYERLARRQGEHERKGELVGQLCFRLSIHIQIEEDIFYPAARAAIGSDATLAHALCDHGGAKELIARLDEMEPGDDDYDATVAVLNAYILAHMAEEQDVIFPKLRSAGLDMQALGRRLAERQKALHQDVTRIGLPLSPAGRREPGVTDYHYVGDMR